jgi:hypothetical protein
MKLRCKNNSLRLRLNRSEVNALARGATLQEQIVFPGEARLSYVLEAGPESLPAATFFDGVIRIGLPADFVRTWAASEEIGLYFDFPASQTILKIAIEKDLECVDGSPEEYDPDAFPRKNCEPKLPTPPAKQS